MAAKKKKSKVGGSTRSTDLADILFPAAEELDLQDGILDVPPEQRRLHTETVDYSVKTIVDSLNSDSIKIPNFQRKYVWTDSQASRLIESLIIQCPVPVVYLSQGADEIYNVVDGNQRLRSLRRFLGNEFQLKGLTAYPELEGNKFVDLDPRFQRHIANRTIRCLIILKDTHPQVKFDVFERLNSGAVKLTAQELRHGIYFGDSVKIAGECAADKGFMRMVAVSNNKRMKLEELVIRFWALRSGYKNYKKPLTSFLNNYCDNSRKVTASKEEKMRELFHEAHSQVSDHFGDLSFSIFDDDHNVKSKFNSALYDSQMVGLSLLLNAGSLRKMTRTQAVKKMQLLLQNGTFVDSISRATSDEKSVKQRINMFVDAFGR